MHHKKRGLRRKAFEWPIFPIKLLVSFPPHCLVVVVVVVVVFRLDCCAVAVVVVVAVCAVATLPFSCKHPRHGEKELPNLPRIPASLFVV